MNLSCDRAHQIDKTMAKMQNGGMTVEIPRDIVPPSIHPSAQEDLTSLDILLIIAQRKKLVGMVTAICTMIALILAFTLPQVYTATVTILPSQGNSSMPASRLTRTNGAVGDEPGSTPEMKNRSDMYVSILKSRSVADAVIQRYGLQSEYGKTDLAEVRKALEKRTDIDGSTKDELIRLSFSDRNPNRAAEVANGYVEQFRNLLQRIAVTEASQRRVIFENQLEKTKTGLEIAERALKSTQLSSGMMKMDGQAQAIIDAAARLRAQIAVEEVIGAIRSYTGDENPTPTRARTELDGLRAKFDDLAGSTGGSADDAFLLKGEVSHEELEYARRLRDVRYYEAILDALAQRLELAKLDEAREGALIQVVDPAVPPEQRSFPKRGFLTTAGVVVGFTFGIMLALLQGGLARMQMNPAPKDKLDLLKRSLWARAISKKEREEVSAGHHPRPEATG